ncbi:MAG: shikimate kinase [Thermodesulfobacteriota bacterium]
MSPERKKPKNIFLVGFMGAGKSTVGRVLARRLGWRYCDADKVIETKAGKTVSEIFSGPGEEHFRQAESETLLSLAGKERQVVATGGGAVMREENMLAMKRGGVTVYLKAPMSVIWERIKHSRTRPLLNVENPLEAATGLLAKRIPFYEAADITVDTEGLTPEEAAEEIMKRLGV